MSCRKIPSKPIKPVSSVGERPFFWLLFFGPAKKSNPPMAEASVFALGASSKEKGNGFRPLRGLVHFFLLAHCRCEAPANGEAGPEGERHRREEKETNQRKRAFPDEANQVHCSRRNFPTRHPGSVGKRRTSMCGALRVWVDPRIGVKSATATVDECLAHTASDSDVNVKSRRRIGGIIIANRDSSPLTRIGRPSSSMLLSMITGDSLKRKFLIG
jgi:hypothetical protein